MKVKTKIKTYSLLNALATLGIFILIADSF